MTTPSKLREKWLRRLHVERITVKDCPLKVLWRYDTEKKKLVIYSVRLEGDPDLMPLLSEVHPVWIVKAAIMALLVKRLHRWEKHSEGWGHADGEFDWCGVACSWNRWGGEYGYYRENRKVRPPGVY